MKNEELTNPVVRAMVTAMHIGYPKAFFALFAPSAKLTDVGSPVPLTEWVDREIFGAHGRLYVESEDREGLGKKTFKVKTQIEAKFVFFGFANLKDATQWRSSGYSNWLGSLAAQHVVSC